MSFWWKPEIKPEEWSKKVGCESRKTWLDKYWSGFWKNYCSGFGLDVGGRGYEENIHAILPSAILVDLDYPSYNGKNLPFVDQSQDYVYNSHVLEHIQDYQQAIKEWHRVVKVGGFIIMIVPHKNLYEKKEMLPSRWNEDHKRFYTPASLLKEIEESLEPNTYRIRHLRDNDKGHDYNQSNEEHSVGEYEIETIIERIK